MDYLDEVYDSLQGVLSQDARLPWVEDMFLPGSPCEIAYAQMLAAYDRLLERLGVEDEDADVEIIINSLMDIQRMLGRKMFLYGMAHARRHD